MPNPSPTISLWLDGRQSIHLSREGAAGTTPILKVHMHNTSKVATLVVHSYQSLTKILYLQLALQYGIFDFFDTKSHTKISVPQEDIELEKLVVQAGAPIRLFDLKLDILGKFWAQLLKPGHTYEISWAHGDNVPWAYRGEVHQDTYERLPVQLGKEPITYTVVDNDMTLLLTSVSVNPTDQVCHLSGEPRFGFKLEVTSRYNEIITVCLYRTPLKEPHGLEKIVRVEDVEGQQVQWDWGIGY
jgi:hypothetical protein